MLLTSHAGGLSVKPVPTTGLHVKTRPKMEQMELNSGRYAAQCRHRVDRGSFGVFGVVSRGGPRREGEVSSGFRAAHQSLGSARHDS